MQYSLTRLICAGFLLLSVSGCAFVSLDLGSMTQVPPLEERVLHKGAKAKILVVEILGVIRTTDARDSFKPRQGTFERLDNVLDKAKGDKAIRGIILKVDSPGGGYTASDLVFRRLQEFKREHRIPVVACIVDQGTSGGYMTVLAADHIVALPSSVVGNVGVLIPSVSVGGLMDKLGIDEQTITSGDMKDAGSPLHDMTPEERAILENIVMEFYLSFMERVKSTRPVTPGDVAVFQDGRVLTAAMGKELHLIDEVGYYEHARKRMESLAGVENPTIVVYRRKGENRGGFYSWP